MRIVYLSSHPDGQAPYLWLEQQPNAKVVWFQNTHHRVNFPLDVEYDLGISFLYHFKIPESELTNHQWINFHPAPLPQYRGRNVAYHAIMNGEQYFGATCHYIDATFDTGNIIDFSNFPIGEGDTAGEIAKKARGCCAKLFYGNMTYLLQGNELQSYPQGEGKYYSLSAIDPYVNLSFTQCREIRAITASPYYAQTVIGGKQYAIVPISELHHPDDEPEGTPKSSPTSAI